MDDQKKQDKEKSQTSIHELNKSLKLKIKLKDKDFDVKSNENIHKRPKSPFIKHNNNNCSKEDFVESTSNEDKKINERRDTPKKEKRSKSKKKKKEQQSQTYNIKEELKDILVNKKYKNSLSNNFKSNNYNECKPKRFQSDKSLNYSAVKQTPEEINEILDKLINKLLLAKEYKLNTEIDLLENEMVNI